MIFVPRALEALVPVWRHVRPELPQTAQLLHLPGRGLPGVEHAGVQRTPAHQHRKQAQQTKHPAPRQSQLHWLEEATEAQSYSLSHVINNVS